MNINEITIGEAKLIIESLTDVSKTTPIKDKEYGLVVCQFIGRFVFIANLSIKGELCYLTNVRNVRYWDTRENGLGDLAIHGKIDGDRIDNWPDQIIPIDKLGPFMQANKEHW